MPLSAPIMSPMGPPPSARSVVRPPASRKLLDAEPLRADPRADRATSVVSDLITSPTERRQWRVSGDPIGVSLNGTVGVANAGNGRAQNPEGLPECLRWCVGTCG